MTTIIMRPYRGQKDLEAITNLINICDAFDNLSQGVSISELQTIFNAPTFDKTRDACLWEDADGQLISYGRLRITEPSEVIDVFLGFYVHPSARGISLETQIIEWSKQRLLQAREEHGLPVKLHCGARNCHTYRIAILENHGFTVERYFFTMERSLSQLIPQPQFPHGFALRYVNGLQDASRMVDLWNNSFIDHWNYHPITVEIWKNMLTAPNYKPELDLVAIASNGTFAAWCRCGIFPEKNARTGRNESSVGGLATRRGFRKMGLGRAMLLSGMHQLKEAGMETVKLDVDADHPNGALRLYKSVSFSELHTQVYYVKDV